VVSVRPENADRLSGLARDAGVPALQIGVVGGSRIRIKIAGRTVIDELVADAEQVWSDAIGSYFEIPRAIA